MGNPTMLRIMRVLSLFKQPFYLYQLVSMLLSIGVFCWIFYILFLTEDEFEPNVRMGMHLSMGLQLLNCLDEVYVSTQEVSYFQSQWFYLIGYWVVAYLLTSGDYIWLQIFFISQIIRYQQDFGFMKLREFKLALSTVED